eukprot:107808_1
MKPTSFIAIILLSQFIICNHVNGFIEEIGEGIIDIGEGIGDIGEGIGDFASDTFESVGDFASQFTNIDGAIDKIKESVINAMKPALDPIKDQLDEVVDDIPFIDEIPEITEKVINNIPTMIREIPKLLDLAKDIPDILLKMGKLSIEFAAKIPEIIVAVFQMFRDPFSFYDNITDEVQEFADDIKNCIGQMKEIINIGGYVDDLLSFIFLFGGLSDSDDILYHTIAFILLPFKDLILFTCEETIPVVVDWGKKIFMGDFRRRLNENGNDINLKFNVSNRRRILNEDGTYATISTCQECARWEEEKRTSLVNEFVNENPHSTEEERREVYYNTLSEPNDSCNEYYVDGNINMKKTLCNSESTAWLYDDPNELLYQKSVKWFDEKLITNKYDTSSTEEFIRFKIAVAVFDVLRDAVDALCEMNDACQPDQIPFDFYTTVFDFADPAGDRDNYKKKSTGKYVMSIACFIFEPIFTMIHNILEFVLDTVVTHDGETNNVKWQNIFQDRYGMIHNQHILKNNMNAQFAQTLTTIQNGMLGILTSTEISSQLETYNMKAIQDKIDNTRYGLNGINDVVDKIYNEQSGFVKMRDFLNKIGQQYESEVISNTLYSIINDESGLIAIKSVVDTINMKISEPTTSAKIVHNGIIIDEPPKIRSLDDSMIRIKFKMKDLHIVVGIIVILFFLVMGVAIFLSVCITWKCCDGFDGHKYETVKYQYNVS